MPKTNHLPASQAFHRGIGHEKAVSRPLDMNFAVVPRQMPHQFAIPGIKRHKCLTTISKEDGEKRGQHSFSTDLIEWPNLGEALS